ncbi:MAG: NAD(P)/FAD-dependent oxidoreductase [Candidatus Eisenbacteria bacterium]|uniref:NADH:ubiquinone reductase (non-electrogenic) n=1 Tax=Eiseniibacteriota bacterium TaxID=2212470 RepID=A0A849SDZ2_UNCEI|nr:NAD(P)/FAD-dependent oxidoreductase [Candidatus Eisenbacteria bacterium]
MPHMAGRRLVIVGGGFAGLDVARAISRSRAAREYWDTVLVDKENFFQFNPLLPAVAVGAVETRHIVYPLREMARHRHVRFYKNKVTSIDLERRTLHLHNDLELPFDALVLAPGSVSNDYGIPGVGANTLPFKTLFDAMTLRARVVELFEMAEQAETVSQRTRLLSILVIGGGVTGVEVAAELTEMATETLLPRYPNLLRSQVSVTLVEGGDRLVRAARPEHSRYVTRHLVKRGVRLRLDARVQRVEPHAVVLTNGEVLEAFTILWTAGVRPPDFVAALPYQKAKDGRVLVDEQLRAVRHDGTPDPHVYVLGDCAASPRVDGSFQPALSQTAVAMGTHVGKRLVAEAEGRELGPFDFRDKGYIISLGKHSSVLELFGVPLSGRLAWLAWAGAYLIKMVGFRKQIEVGLDHLMHFVFEHDTSQIMSRSQILSDEELNLSLDSDAPARQSAARTRAS